MSDPTLAGSGGGASAIGPMCIYMKDYGKLQSGQLQSLRGENALLDLEILCQEQRLKVHKVLLASASRFFKDQLCQANVLVPVLIRLEDFGLHLHFEAVTYVVEFVYKGEVVIPGERLSDVCVAAHSLGIHGLTDFLPEAVGPAKAQPGPPEPGLGSGWPALDQPAQSGYGWSAPPAAPASPAAPAAPAACRSGDSEYSSGSHFATTSSHAPHLATSESGEGQPWVQTHAYMGDETLAERSQYYSTDQYDASHPLGSTGVLSEPNQEHGHVFQYNPNLMTEAGVTELMLETAYPPSGSNLGNIGGDLQQGPTHESHGERVTYGATGLPSPSKRWREVDANEEGIPPPMMTETPKTPQGKLRVIAQGMMNASENIQIPSSREPSLSTPSKSASVGKVVLERDELVSTGEREDPGPTSEHQAPLGMPKIIQTPLNANQVAWLASKKNTDVSLDSCLEPVARVEVPGGTWTLTNPKTGGREGSWTVLADNDLPNAAQGPQEGEARVQGGADDDEEEEAEVEPEDTDSKSQDRPSTGGQPNWHLLSTFNGTGSACPQDDELDPEVRVNLKSDDQMLAIRSGVPLALQSRKRKRIREPLPEEDEEGGGGEAGEGCKSSRKCDLGIRKDLTLPSAPKPGEDNVFQSEDQDLAIQFPLIQLDDDEDFELTIRGIAEGVASQASGSSGLVRTASTSQEYQCVECTMGFSKAGQLRRHVKNVHKKDEAQVFCPVCKIGGILGKEDLKVHLYKEHGIGQMFRCEECDFECLAKSQYISHLSLHSFKDDKLKCVKCEKEFKSRNGLRLHLKQHFQEKMFHCSYCDFTCTQKLSLIKHLAGKHRKDLSGKDLEELYDCAECAAKFVAEFQLKEHVLRKHTSRDKMRFRCELCDYASVEKAAVDRHVRFKHTNDRPFECEICGFRTHTMAAMARHKRGHFCEKPFVCGICGKAYADSKRLRDHKFRHEGKFPFVCQLCGFCTRRKDSLNNHMLTQHRESQVEAEVQDPSQSSEGDKAKPNRSKGLRSRHESGGIAKSHIVGHINLDGSIRPICNVEEDERNIQTSPAPVVNADEVIVIRQNASSSIGLANELTIRDEGLSQDFESGSEIAADDG